jgi:hypothetical protein
LKEKHGIENNEELAHSGGERRPEMLVVGRSRGSAVICGRLSFPSSGSCASGVLEGAGAGTMQLVALAQQGVFANQLAKFAVQARKGLFRSSDVGHSYALPERPLIVLPSQSPIRKVRKIGKSARRMLEV